MLGKTIDEIKQHCIERALKGFILPKTSELIEDHSLVYLCKKAAAVVNDIISYYTPPRSTGTFFLLPPVLHGLPCFGAG